MGKLMRQQMEAPARPRLPLPRTKDDMLAAREGTRADLGRRTLGGPVPVDADIREIPPKARFEECARATIQGLTGPAKLTLPVFFTR